MRYIIDSNLLILFVIGSLRIDWIGRRSHVKNFTRDDFERLENLVAESDGIILVPHVLTETANLSVKEVVEPLFSEIRAMLKAIIEAYDEFTIASRLAAGRPEYSWLGLTDATILAASVDNVGIATADGNLARAAWAEGRTVVYFPVGDAAARR